MAFSPCSRCGWLDLVVLKYSNHINNYTNINLTKLDILDTFSEIKVATAYNIVPPKDSGLQAETLETFPAELALLDGTSTKGSLEIEYKTFKGWMTTTTGCQKWQDLPLAAKHYVEFVESELGIPISHIGKRLFPNGTADMLTA